MEEQKQILEDLQQKVEATLQGELQQAEVPDNLKLEAIRLSSNNICTTQMELMQMNLTKEKEIALKELRQMLNDKHAQEIAVLQSQYHFELEHVNKQNQKEKEEMVLKHQLDMDEMKEKISLEMEEKHLHILENLKKEWALNVDVSLKNVSEELSVKHQTEMNKLKQNLTAETEELKKKIEALSVEKRQAESKHFILGIIFSPISLLSKIKDFIVALKQIQKLKAESEEEMAQLWSQLDGARASRQELSELKIQLLARTSHVEELEYLKKDFQLKWDKKKTEHETELEQLRLYFEQKLKSVEENYREELTMLHQRLQEVKDYSIEEMEKSQEQDMEFGPSVTLLEEMTERERLDLFEQLTQQLEHYKEELCSLQLRLDKKHLHEIELLRSSLTLQHQENIIKLKLELSDRYTSEIEQLKKKHCLHLEQLHAKISEEHLKEITKIRLQSTQDAARHIETEVAQRLLLLENEYKNDLGCLQLEMQSISRQQEEIEELKRKNTELKEIGIVQEKNVKEELEQIKNKLIEDHTAELRRTRKLLQEVEQTHKAESEEWRREKEILVAETEEKLLLLRKELQNKAEYEKQTWQKQSDLREAEMTCLQEQQAALIVELEKTLKEQQNTIQQLEDSLVNAQKPLAQYNSELSSTKTLMDKKLEKAKQLLEEEYKAKYKEAQSRFVIFPITSVLIISCKCFHNHLLRVDAKLKEKHTDELELQNKELHQKHKEHILSLTSSQQAEIEILKSTLERKQKNWLETHVADIQRNNQVQIAQLETKHLSDLNSLETRYLSKIKFLQEEHKKTLDSLQIKLKEQLSQKDKENEMLLTQELNTMKFAEELQICEDNLKIELANVQKEKHKLMAAEHEGVHKEELTVALETQRHLFEDEHHKALDVLQKTILQMEEQHKRTIQSFQDLHLVETEKEKEKFQQLQKELEKIKSDKQQLEKEIIFLKTEMEKANTEFKKLYPQGRENQEENILIAMLRSDIDSCRNERDKLQESCQQALKLLLKMVQSTKDMEDLICKKIGLCLDDSLTSGESQEIISEETVLAHPLKTIEQWKLKKNNRICQGEVPDQTLLEHSFDSLELSLIEGYLTERHTLEEALNLKEESEHRLVAELENLKAQIQKLTQHNARFAEEQKLLISQNKALTANVGEREVELIKEIERLAKTNLELQCQAEKDCSNLNTQMKILEIELEDQLNKNQKLAAMASEVIDLRQQLEALERQLKNQRDFMDKQAIEREHERDEFQEEIQKLEMELKLTTKSQASGKSRTYLVESLHNEIKERVDDYNRLFAEKEQIEKVLASRNEEIEKLEGQVRELQCQNKEVAKNVDKLMQELEKMQKKEIELKEVSLIFLISLFLVTFLIELIFQVLEKQMLETEVMKSTIEELRSEKEHLLRNKTEEIEELHKVIKKLQKESSALKPIYHETENGQGNPNNFSLEEQEENLDNKFKEGSQSLLENEKGDDNCVLLSSSQNELKRQLEMSLMDKETLQQLLNEKESQFKMEFKILEQNLENVQESSRQYCSELTSLQLLYKELKEEHMLLKVYVMQKEDEMKEMNSCSQDLEVNLREREMKLLETELQLQTVSEQNVEQAAKVQHMTKNIVKLENELKIMTQALHNNEATYQKKISELQVSVVELKAEIEKKVEELELLRSEKDLFHSQLKIPMENDQDNYQKKITCPKTLDVAVFFPSEEKEKGGEERDLRNISATADFSFPLVNNTEVSLIPPELQDGLKVTMSRLQSASTEYGSITYLIPFQTVLKMVYDESYKILVLSEKSLPLDDGDKIQQGPSVEGWQRERLIMVDIVQSLKNYLKQSNKENKEKGQPKRAMEHLSSSDRNSLLSDMQDLEVQLRLTQLQSQEKLQELQETLINTENHGKKQEHQLQKQVELLEHKFQQQQSIANDLQASLKHEQEKASEMHELLKQEHTAILNLNSALENKERSITATLENLQREHLKNKELQIKLDEQQKQHKIKEDEKSKAVEELQAALELQCIQNNQLTLALEHEQSANSNLRKELQIEHSRCEAILTKDQNKLLELQKNLDIEKKQNADLLTALNHERVLTEHLTIRLNDCGSCSKDSLQELQAQLHLERSNSTKLLAIIEKSQQQIFDSKKQIEEMHLHCKDFQEEHDLQNSVQVTGSMMQSKKQDVVHTLEVQREKEAQTKMGWKQLQSVVKSTRDQEIRTVQGERKTAQEQQTECHCLRALLEAQENQVRISYFFVAMVIPTSIIHSMQASEGYTYQDKHGLQNGLKATNYAATKTNVPENKQTVMSSSPKIQKLYRKYLRAESFRKALVYQKKYLLLLLGGFQECEQATLSLIARMGIYPSPPDLNVSETRSRFFTKFRSAVRVVIAILRLKFLVRKWHKVNKKEMPLEAISSSLGRNSYPVASLEVLKQQQPFPSYAAPEDEYCNRNNLVRLASCTVKSLHHLHNRSTSFTSQTSSKDPDDSLTEYIAHLEAIQERLGILLPGQAAQEKK
ncbi:Pericentrin [Ophiophagus hannah]|uniref:Pericentrin n=1 Tax=Ophiophagus hannah TaxID=8665 RepID=V8PEB3_OPHHA|nr:Pericentrin [Ophiophagus hannah]